MSMITSRTDRKRSLAHTYTYAHILVNLLRTERHKFIYGHTCIYTWWHLGPIYKHTCMYIHIYM